MSEAVSALNMVAANGPVSVRELGLRGMVTLRGDLSDAALRKAVSGITGTDVPGMRQIAVSGEGGVAWMSPDELLLLVPHAKAEAAVARLDADLGRVHHLAVNVSDARALIEVSGPYAREVMAKITPVDLAPGAFGPGDFRRTRLAQVPAAFWMVDDTAFRVICFRSVAQYVFDLLSISAKAGPVGAFGDR